MLTQAQFRSICSSELGKPYIWGASGPSSYDCSGLMQVLLARLNLDPPGDQTAEGLYRHFLKGGRSTPVTLVDSALGDLVFFGGSASVGHIGMAWGGGEMIEAGGGGRTTTTPAIARQQGAEVRIRPITRRRDRVAILRPTALHWGTATAANPLEAVVPGFGRYEGDLVTAWLSDGRHMQLKEPYAYYSQDGTAWPVPAETIVDGASIPRPFWSLIGGPLEGLFRNASVIHDHYCDEKTRAWRDTHRMFYEAMRCNDVDRVKAKIMYYAVYRFGPRWELPTLIDFGLPTALESIVEPTPAPLAADSFDEGTTNHDLRTIADTDPDLTTIEALADERKSAGIVP